MGGGVSGWLPSALFAASELGVWYDPSDFSSMFQDSAGTTPVTAVGDPVGKINDKSGNGKHATQSTSAARPVLRQDGAGKYYLEFDGTDDSLSIPSISFAGGAGSLFVGSRIAAANHILLHNDPQTTYLMCAESGIGADPDSGFGTTAYRVNTTTLSPKTRAALYTACANITTVSTVTGLTIATDAYFIGRFSSYRFNGRLYSFILRGAASSAGEITNAETWVNGKTGAY